jgi:hypothetical protein
LGLAVILSERWSLTGQKGFEGSGRWLRKKEREREIEEPRAGLYREMTVVEDGSWGISDYRKIMERN